MYFFPLKFVSVGCRHHKTLPRVSSPENNNLWASVVVQWLRIHLAMQGTPIPSLVQEDSTWLSAAKPISSVTQSCPSLCNPMNCSTPSLPVHHQLLEFIQTHVLWVSDAIQPSDPLSSPFPPAFNLSQHQGLFKWGSSFFFFWVSSSNQMAKVLAFQLQHQSLQWIFRTDFL